MKPGMAVPMQIVCCITFLPVKDTGAAIAARHVWIQSLPPDRIPECGPGLDFMLANLPLAQALQKALTGSGECAAVAWSFMGLSMPWWTLLWYLALGALLLFAGFRRSR